MTFKELKNFISKIPSKMDDYNVVNGEWGLLDVKDENSVVYRCDKPVTMITFDQNTKEVVFLHQIEKDINAIIENGNPETIKV
jgi:hypothetical protein